MRKTLETTMQRLGYPSEAIDSLLHLYDRLANDPPRMRRIEGLMVHYWEDEEDLHRVLDSLKDLSVCAGESMHAVHHLFLLMLTPELRERYAKANIPEWIFWNSMEDLRAKVIECHKMNGVWGSEPYFWFDWFYRLKRFGLGRLQFEYNEFPFEEGTVHGITFHKGDPVVNIHIPSLGPLTRELRLDAYRKAYEFFKDYYRDRYHGMVPIECHSWLLYPKHEEYFPEGSHIVEFIHDFKPLHCTPAKPGLENFDACWRVFYKPKGTPAEEMPRETRLQRAMLDWFAKGGDSGAGFGMMVVDENGIYTD